MRQFGSVAELARVIGVSDNAIYKWMAGRGQLSLISIVDLAKAAGISVEWLATGHEPAKKNTPDRRTSDGSPEFVQMPRRDIPGNARRSSVQGSQIIDHLSFRAVG